MQIYRAHFCSDPEGSDMVHRAVHLRDFIGWIAGACGDSHHSVQHAQDESE
jgi:hypothetical protein